MQFLYPGFLWALALLSIPIIIHLFNFRRYKTVYFSNTRFLKEIKEDKAARSKVKHLLVLLSRLLAVMFLVFAFAQPFIPKADSLPTEGVNYVSIFVDNSFSMQTEGAERSLFEEARASASSIAMGYGPNDRFQLLTHDFEGRHQRFINREEFISYLDELEVTPVSKTMEEVFVRQNDAFEMAAAENRNRFVISDFQRSFVNEFSDTAAATFLVPIKAEHIQNVYIDSVWLTAPIIREGEPAEVIVSIRNSGSQPTEQNRLTLEINNETKAISDFSVPANDGILDTILFTADESGWQSAKLSIRDYPIDFDDDFYFTFFVKAYSPVLVIHDQQPGRYLRTLFTEEPFFNLDERRLSQLDYATLRNYDFIVLEHIAQIPSGLVNSLSQFVEEGGSLMVFPSPNADIEMYNNFFRQMQARPFTQIIEDNRAVNVLNAEHEIFSQVFEEIPENISLPSVFQYYGTVSGLSLREEPLLEFRRGEPFISQYRHGRGFVYVSVTPLLPEWTDLPNHALIVPVVLNASLSGGSRMLPAYTIGKSQNIEIDHGTLNPDEVIRLVGDNIEIIPGQFPAASRVQLYVDEELPEAGIYRLEIPGSETSPLVAFNYDRSESELVYYSISELSDLFAESRFDVIEARTSADVERAMVRFTQGQSLWKYCLMLVLVFLAFESLLLRFWKT